MLSKRLNADGSVSYTVRAIDPIKNHEYSVSGQDTSNDFNTAKTIFQTSTNFTGPVNIEPYTIQAMLRDEMKKYVTAEPAAPAPAIDPAQIKAKVSRFINPAMMSRGDSVVVKVVAPDGDPTIVKSSGNTDKDNAVIRAIMSSGPLPGTGEVELTF